MKINSSIALKAKVRTQNTTTHRKGKQQQQQQQQQQQISLSPMRQTLAALGVDSRKHNRIESITMMSPQTKQLPYPSKERRKICRTVSARRALLLVFAPYALAISLVQASTKPHFSTRRSFVHTLRGGNNDDNNNTEGSTAATPRFWSSQSLHRMNQDIMAGARSFDAKQNPPQEKEKFENKRRGRRGRKQQEIDRAQNGRGGALTAVKPAAPPPRTGFFRWLGQSGENEADKSKEKKETQRINSEPQGETNNANATGPDLAKLWWVNVWTQQLPDRPESLANDINTATLKDGTVTPDKDVLRKEQEKVRSQAPTKKQKKDLTEVVSLVKNATALNATAVAGDEQEENLPPSYVSTGAWAAIDGLTSLGLSSIHPVFRVSRPLRPIRKATARVTGLHGVFSGKPRKTVQRVISMVEETPLDEEDLAKVRRRIAAIDKAREKVAKTDEMAATKKRNRWWGGRSDPVDIPEVKQISTVAAEMTIPSIRKSPEELEEERRRKERVKEIDRLMSEAQVTLQQLACEKDDLQRRPNPLFTYSTEKVSKRKDNRTTITTRQFNFPPDDLVEEYLETLFSAGRLVKLNHTDLWLNDGLEDEEDESIGDDLLMDEKRKRNDGNGGNWILRQSIGKGSTLGEKIGEAAEQAAYKAIGKSIMSVLARSISALHGVNIMTHTDIRLSMEATPDLPPISKQGEIIPGGRKANYARDALQGAMRRGAKRNREKRYRYDLSEDEFVQRDAVVETLLSHCQISAPLLTLFPLAWQRAMLANIITLVTAVIADFLEGVQFEILGHRLSFSFKPITESDMINHIAMAGPNLNRQSLRSEQFEAAVQATADDLAENLKFLDRWHERALGSGMLRSQIGNLIARLVLTLVGEILSGAQMDLWAAQAGGPRMVAGLEFRTTPTYMEEQS